MAAEEEDEGGEVITIELSQAQFGITAFWPDKDAHDRGDDPMAAQIRVTDPQSGITMVVPFDAPAWQTFRRHVEKNGEVPAIEIARENGVPRMDVPRGG
jgi:hypothetical protein